MTTRNVIFSEIQTGIREVLALEENGYQLDDHSYMDKGAYWWYSPVGDRHVVPTLQYEEPSYPQVPWYFAGITLNGNLVHEESRIIADTLEREDIYLCK